MPEYATEFSKITPYNYITLIVNNNNSNIVIKNIQNNAEYFVKSVFI